MGKYDLVEQVLEELGAEFFFTGAMIQPGKPVVFGELPLTGTKANQKPRPTQWRSMQWNGAQCFMGLPGNPVSSAVTFLLFAAPILAALAGRSARGSHIDRGPRFTLARLAADVKAKPGLTRFLPAACTFAGPVPEVALVSWQGSGDLAAMALANCYLVVPDDCDHLDAGATVNILLL